MSNLDLRQGHALEVLRDLPAESVQCVVTSPPYWGLRDYGLPPSTWGDGWTGCLGLEPTPQQFLVHLVELFGEVRRVLRKDGTLWFNMGDCYGKGHGGSSTEAGGYTMRKAARGEFTRTIPLEGQGHRGGFQNVVPGIRPKDRLMLPARCALALQADGWWIRSEIVWAKPNPMPSSVTDRPTDAHEMLYLLTRAPRYFYDADAVRERAAVSTLRDRRIGTDRPLDVGKVVERYGKDPAQARTHARNAVGDPAAGRNRRTVWTIPTQAFPGAHFATFPERLVAPCILAGTSERGACSECGAPWRRVVETSRDGDTCTAPQLDAVIDQGAPSSGGGKESRRLGGEIRDTRTTTGWEPTCAHADAPTRPCVVLDPFSGSGTTGLVARKLGRSYVGIELSEEYLALSRARLGDRDALAELREGEDDPGAQLGLFG